MHDPIIRSPYVGFIPLLSIIEYGWNWIYCIIKYAFQIHNFVSEKKEWKEIRGVYFINGSLFKFTTIRIIPTIEYLGKVCFPVIVKFLIFAKQVHPSKFGSQTHQVRLLNAHQCIEIGWKHIDNDVGCEVSIIGEPPWWEIPSTFSHAANSLQYPLFFSCVCDVLHQLYILLIWLGPRGGSFSIVEV